MLGTWRTCQHRMHLEYVARLPRGRDSFSIAFGSAMHATIAHWWRYGARAVTTTLRQGLRDVWESQFQLGIMDARFDKYDIREFGTERFARTELLKQGFRVLDLFLETTAPMFAPLDVELPFCVTPPGRPFDLRGTPDMNAEAIRSCPCCGEDLGRGVVDWKFSLSPASYTDASHEEWVQGTCYTPAFIQRYGRLPDFVALVKFKRVGRGGPSWSIYHSHRTQDDVDALYRELDNLWHDIEYGIHPPTGLGSPLCTRQWCAFYGECEPRLAEERRYLETSGL